MLEEKIKMLIEMGLLNLILCKKNHQRTVFQGKAQRILLIPVRNVWLGTSGSTRSAVVGMVRRAEIWNSWNDQRCLWDKQPELRGDLNCAFTLYCPFASSPSFLQHSFQVLSTSWRLVCIQLLIICNSCVITHNMSDLCHYLLTSR